MVSRLVDRLNRAEEEKDTATLQLKGERGPAVDVSLTESLSLFSLSRKSNGGFNCHLMSV